MSSDAGSDPMDQVGEWCAGKPSATRDNPFGPQVDVYRVGGKIFALVSLDEDQWVILKALPEDVLALCQEHEFIRPGYHMNKRHWITVDLALGGFPVEVKQLIDESWLLVCESLPKSHPARVALSP